MLQEPPLGLAALSLGGRFMAFPKGAGRDDPQQEAWLAAMLPQLWLLSACVSKPAPLPTGMGMVGLQRQPS